MTNEIPRNINKFSAQCRQHLEDVLTKPLKFKHIYLVERISDCDYDEYDSFVCVHESEDGAKKIANQLEGMNENDCNVTLIGIADNNLEIGYIICKSFNAG